MPAVKIIISCALTLGGLLFLAMGFWQMSGIKSFVAGARRAKANYVGRTMETAPTEVGTGSVYRQYQFIAQNGKIYGCSSIIGGSASEPKNKSVEVLYDPQDPTKARINSFVELYGAPAIFLTCGAGFLLAAPIVGYLLFA